MPLGIVSNNDFEQELESLESHQTKPSKVEYKEIKHGRGDDDKNVPDSLRKVIGETAIEEGRESAIQLASEFGISPSSVSAYSKGATSTTTYNRTPNKPVIDKARDKVVKVARNKLRLAMHNITTEKLSSAKIGELAIVASAMNKIVVDNTPDVNNRSGPMVGIQIFCPRVKEEDEFKIIPLNDD
jgi:predicted transcriptional regulator